MEYAPVRFSPLQESDWQRFHDMVMPPDSGSKSKDATKGDENSNYDSNSEDDDYEPENKRVHHHADISPPHVKPVALPVSSGAGTVFPPPLLNAAPAGRSGSLMLAIPNPQAVKKSSRRVSSFLDQDNLLKFGPGIVSPMPTIAQDPEESPTERSGKAPASLPQKLNMELKPVAGGQKAKPKIKRNSVAPGPINAVRARRGIVVNDSARLLSVYGQQSQERVRNLIIRRAVPQGPRRPVRGSILPPPPPQLSHTPPRRKSAMVVPNAPRRGMLEDEDSRITDSSTEDFAAPKSRAH